MNNRGLILAFTIIFGLACLYQLSFTWVVSGVEKDAKAYAGSDLKLEEAYLDSMKNIVVYKGLDYTYGDLKKKVLNLGLDLKGGMNVTLEVEIAEVVRALSSNSSNASFVQAMKTAKANQANSDKDFVTLFEEAFLSANPDGKLAAIFYTQENKDKLSIKASNEEVIDFIREATGDAIDNSFRVLRTRIGSFGVAQPNIQKLESSDRILVELPGVKSKETVRKLLQGSAKLEFWETHEAKDLNSSLEQANKVLSLRLYPDLNKPVAVDTSVTEETVEEVVLEGETVVDSTEEESLEDILSTPTTDTSGATTADNAADAEKFKKENPLYAVLQPYIYQTEQGGYAWAPGPVVGLSLPRDTATVNEYLSYPEVKASFSPDVKFLWSAKTINGGEALGLLAIKVSRNGRAPLEGDVVTDARQGVDPTGQVDVSMMMNAQGSKKWQRMTKDNVGKSVAIALDDHVYSYPNVNGEIAGGSTSISGNFSIEEAKLIANILRSGKLPAPARIVEESVVGPSLGKESIRAGLVSFLIAILIVLAYMIFYYAKAGVAASIALITNMFFIIGVLASTSIALTLPGIAGIVLTIGMSVDANVLIFERIREELSNGKGMRLAVSDGFKHAYSSIIDANVTTLLTGFVLWYFGTGPVQGFAKVLVIGIFTSLFTAIFITRLIFEYQLAKQKGLSFSTAMTKGLFKDLAVQFLASRKKFYIISAVVIALGMGSLFTKGLQQGVDFSGGRTFVVRFDDQVATNEVASKLTDVFEGAPEVKTFGSGNQVKITTNYLINSEAKESDQEVEDKLNEGLSASGLTYEVMSSQKVGPTIADDIKKSAFWAIIFALFIIFVYILFRFKRWEFGVGALAALFHDVLIVLSVFSIFYGILPFSLEIDQAFIAAILTVVGYSINDTVVVFDRIREYLGAYKKRETKEVFNSALNSTLSRTINTSLSTIVVLLMIFIFGGEVIRGFSFALLVGVIVGTYSSLFIASPIVFDLAKNKLKPITKKKK